MSLKQISMLQIDYFLAVARHLNFTEAAKSQYISQPSISKRIALFEKEIGVQLFFRTKSQDNSSGNSPSQRIKRN